MIKLNNYQNNNYIYLKELQVTTSVIENIIQNSDYTNINNDTDIFNNINTNVSTQSNTIQNYIIKSSPGQAYKLNLKKYHLKQISKYSEFYGRNVRVYPNSYYETSYDKIFKPFEYKNTEKQKTILNPRSKNYLFK